MIPAGEGAGPARGRPDAARQHPQRCQWGKGAGTGAAAQCAEVSNRKRPGRCCRKGRVVADAAVVVLQVVMVLGLAGGPTAAEDAGDGSLFDSEHPRHLRSRVGGRFGDVEEGAHRLRPCP
jgi:hypothetical protein